MSTASTVKGPQLQPSCDKTAWLQNVCGEPANGEDFICCCRPNFGEGSGLNEGQAIEHDCSAQHREGVEMHEGCSVILEGIVYLAAAASASTGSQNSGLSYVTVLTIEQCVCRSASSPKTDDISNNRSLPLAATAAAEQQYQKP